MSPDNSKALFNVNPVREAFVSVIAFSTLETLLSFLLSFSFALLAWMLFYITSFIT
jgi:hypothetical protein